MSRENLNPNELPIENSNDLLEIFRKGECAKSRFRLGIEMELPGVQAVSGRAISYEGPSGIGAILESLAAVGDWERVLDQGRLIALHREGTAVTLEPGGQLELSGRPHHSVFELETEVQEFLGELREISRTRGVRFLALGIQPVTPRDEMEWVPKSRYRIMRKYYESRPGLALDMMTLTASIQANFDYCDEPDAHRKIHVGSVLAPVIAAITANACVERGRLNGYASRRPIIWAETDPDRCGVPSFFVDGSFSFEKYRDYALDVPMYFINRDGGYVDMTAKTFRQYMKEGKPGDVIRADWESHLTTLFPDSRLKGHLELRTADSVPVSLAVALMAFWKGLFYDDDSLDSAFRFLQGFTAEELRRSMKDVAERGLQAEIGKRKVLEIGKEVASMASIGLSRIDDQTGSSDAHRMAPIHEILDRGTSPAEEFRKSWDGSIETLIRKTEI